MFGAAQPRAQGLRAILSILRAHPTETSPSHVIWFSTREEPIGIHLSALPSLPQLSLRVPGKLVYISGRPFVLRDASEPRKTLPLSDRPVNLEAIEQRLKNDILAEGIRCGCLLSPLICAIFCHLLCRFGGLVLTHNEIGKELAVYILCDPFDDVLAIEDGDGDGAILPTWTAVDSSNVRTSRELWEYMRSEGWHVEVSAAL